MQHGYGQKTCTFPAHNAKSPEVFLVCQALKSNYICFCKCIIESTAVVRQAAADRFDFVPSSEMPQLPTAEKRMLQRAHAVSVIS